MNAHIHTELVDGSCLPVDLYTAHACHPSRNEGEGLHFRRGPHLVHMALGKVVVVAVNHTSGP